MHSSFTMGHCVSRLTAYTQQVDLETGVCPRVHVFWDHENIPSSSADVVHNIMNALTQKFPRLNLHPVPTVNVYRVSHGEASKALDHQGCNLITCPQHALRQKEVVDWRIMNDMWQLVTFKTPILVVLVADDGDYAAMMTRFRYYPWVTTVQCCTKGYQDVRCGARHMLAWWEQVLQRSTPKPINDSTGEDEERRSSEPAIGTFLRVLFDAVDRRVGKPVLMSTMGMLVKEEGLDTTFQTLHKEAHDDKFVRYGANDNRSDNVICITKLGVQCIYPEL
jgi:hypothetical protein